MPKSELDIKDRVWSLESGIDREMGKRKRFMPRSWYEKKGGEMRRREEQRFTGSNQLKDRGQEAEMVMYGICNISKKRSEQADGEIFSIP